MPEENVLGQVERLSEALVFAEPTDMPALASIHTDLQHLHDWAVGADMPEVAQAMAACTELVERLVLEEADDPAHALEAVSQAVSCLQLIVRDGRALSEVTFPEELGVAPGKEAKPLAVEEPPDSAPPKEPTKPKPQTEKTPETQKSTPGVGGFVMSAIVDERILGEFVARQPGVLADMEGLILAIEGGEDGGKLAELRRAIHTLKGEAGLVGFIDVERVCHVIEDAMHDMEITGLTDLLLDTKDWLSRVFDAFVGKCEAPESCEGLLRRLAALRGLEEPEAPEAPEAVGEPEVSGDAAGKPAKVEAPAVLEMDVGAVPKSAEEEEAEAALPEDEPALKLDARPLTAQPDLLSEFVTEATEHLENADVHLLTVETEPSNPDALNAVFRAFHTIKGVAGFLDLPEIQLLAHESENLFDLARKGEVLLKGASMDLTFDAVDTMKRLVLRVGDCLASGDLLAPEPGLGKLVGRIRRAVKGTLSAAPSSEPIPESDRLVGEILVAEGSVTEEAVREALDECDDTIPDPLGQLLVKESFVSRALVEEALTFQKANGVERPLGEILVELGALRREDLERILTLQAHPEKPKVGETLVRRGDVDARDVARALRSQTRPEEAAAGPQRKVEVREAVRVDADRLDRLIDLIGELVIAESMVGQSPELLQVASSDLLRYMSQLDKITRELQSMGTSLRMVPVKGTFQKMARLVRDLAKKSGKKVSFSMFGEDTDLDKTVVDRIGDPLVHMVRNAVDHGLETTPEDRVKAGKDEAGRVCLRAFHKGGSVYIEIEDDGRGLDRDAILAKAAERDLLREGDKLTDREVWNLIFEPGFSTAQKITDVSGRGVGMDVVRRNIEALRGQVEIRSEKGKGSIFSIRLPLTLAIIDGMVIRIEKERYIIPTLSVVRSVRPQREEIHSVVNKGEMLSLQGELIPMFRLGSLFKLGGAIQDPTQALVVVIESDGMHAGLLVDELLGQQQTVIKSLGETMQGIAGIAGGAIMSDGRVGLILDVSGIVRMANVDETEAVVEA